MVEHNSITIAESTKHQLEISGLGKTYPDGTRALIDVDLIIQHGEIAAVVGLSGAGKSTLLRCINRLIDPTTGSIIYSPLNHHHYAGKINGRAQDSKVTQPFEVCDLNGDGLFKYRSRVGMIFQHFNLVPRLSVLLNVLAGRLSRVGTFSSILRRFSPEDIDRALSALKRVGIVEKAYRRAGELSGGQMQRVGIARALVQEPEILLADEPVASLDPATSADILGYLRTICVEDGLTLLINLHSVDLVRKFCKRAIGFRDGRKVYDGTADGLGREEYLEIYGVQEGV